jgi:hypothetical protein
MVASFQRLGNKYLSFLIVDVKEAGVFIILPSSTFLLVCVLTKWFGTYTPCKCKSHNEVYLHNKTMSIYFMLCKIM